MSRRTITVLTAVFLIGAAGCERDEQGDAAPAARAEPTPMSTPTAVAPRTVTAVTRPAGAPRVVFLGDSITAGLGVDAGEAFPARVAEMLEADGVAVDVVNAGVSGDTTAGGLRRIDWVLKQNPDVVVVGLGGNDGLRGTDVAASEANLRGIIARARDARASVLLLGMLIPPNYGPEYTAQFRDVYPRLAKELGVPLVPFVLEGVGGEANLNQRDGIHPTAAGHEVVARNVMPYLRDLLEQRMTTTPTTQPVTSPGEGRGRGSAAGEG